MYSTGSYMQFRQQTRYPKPRSGSNEDIRCDVCNISIRGHEQFQVHLSGSKHAKKVLELENTKKIEGVPYLRFEEYSGVYKCTICHVSLNSASVAMFHLEGNRHQEAVTALQTTGKTNGNDEVKTKDQFVNQRNNRILPLMDVPVEFKTTKMTLNSNYPVRPNRPNFHQNANMMPPVGPMFRYQSKPLDSSFVSKYTLHTIEASFSTRHPRARLRPSTGLKLYPCLACNITTNSEIQLQAHLSSEKHKSRLGPGSGPNGSQQNGPPPRPVLSALRCESCNISANSQIQLDQHLQSPKHRNTLKMRFQPY